MQLLHTARLVALQMLRRWYLIVAAVAISIILVAGWSQLSSPSYVTSMTVTAPQTSASGLSGAMGALSGTASALGLSVGGGQASQFDSYIALLQSESVSEKLMDDPHIMAELFKKSIDPVTGQWKETSTRHLKDAIFAAFNVHRASKPTLDDVHLLVNEMLVINVAPLNRNMATVSCTSSDPVTCRDLLLAVDHAAQDQLDSLATASARRMTAYLENVLSNVKEVALQQALTTAMANSEVQEQLMGVGQQRALVLDPPKIPAVPAYPKPATLISLAIFAGLIIGGAAAWFVRDITFHRALKGTAGFIRLRRSSQVL